MKSFYLIVLTLLFYSCASVPSSTVTLTKDIIHESDNMYQLNVALVNQLFDERRERIDLFIKNTYTPSLLKNYEKLLPDTLNYKRELPNILSSIVPVINHKKDSLQNILNLQEQEVLKQLANNYTNYSKATTSLQNLINSLVKVKTTENDALLAIDKLTGNEVNFKKIESTINNSIDTAGSDLGKLVQIEKVINQK
ncbi:hypothetical protein [Tenacibaculum sp.]|uniref:hypothetical protein n=1 Tax=Tenacibaculum sp. TaxID=1906242 RepID=UPI003D0C08E2